MLDIKFIRQNPELVKEGCRKKQAQVDVDKILDLDKKRGIFLKEIEDLRHKQKSFGKEQIDEARKNKEGIKKLEENFEEMNSELQKLILLLPNLPLEDVPEGKDENDNVVLREVGEKPNFSSIGGSAFGGAFKPKDYLEIAEKLDWIDVARAAKVSGSRFGYLKNQAALLEFALMNFGLDILLKEGFVPVIPPVIVNEKAMGAMGYLDRGKDEIYHLEKDNLYLVGTSEQSIGPMHMDEIFEEKDLPRRYVSFSTCFRREAGSYGRDTKGILRVHQFDKMEMFVFCKPEDSIKEHKFLLSLEEKLMRALELPYRVINTCGGELGDPAAAKYDIEVWFPSQNLYRETHSTSNCTDFQARRLNIRYKDDPTLTPPLPMGGKREGLNFVHTLNGTVFSQRPILAIIENFQQKDGSVKIPQVLEKYLIKRQN